MGSACNNARLRNARRIVEDSSTRPSPPSVFGHVKRAVTCVSNHHHRAFHSLTIISIVRWTQLCVDSFGANLGDVFRRISLSLSATRWNCTHYTRVCLPYGSVCTMRTSRGWYELNRAPPKCASFVAYRPVKFGVGVLLRRLPLGSPDHLSDGGVGYNACRVILPPFRIDARRIHDSANRILN